MSDIPYLYVGFALMAGALALITMWSRRRARWRLAAAGLLVMVLGLGYFSLIDLLSRPKPLRLELAGLNDARVISAVLREDEAIYLWLNVEDQPRFFSIPWDKNLAIELQNTMRSLSEREEEAERDGENPNVDTFYAVPQASRPPEKEPVIVRGPAWEM